MKSIMLAIAVPAALALLGCNSAKANFVPPTLGSAGSFAVLGGTTVTSTGNTVLNGNLGVYSGSAITGFPPGIVNGTTYTSVNGNGAVAEQAQSDALAAYNTLTSEPVTETLTGQDLGGLTLTPGVYFFSSTAQLTGTLILSGTGTFVFQIGSGLTTASSSSVVLEDGAEADDVFWQVGSSATLGTGTSFNGSIVALTSITFDTGANLYGSALALNGAVTLDDNDINVPGVVPVPEATTVLAGVLLLLPLGASTLQALRKKRTA